MKICFLERPPTSASTPRRWPTSSAKDKTQPCRFVDESPLRKEYPAAPSYLASDWATTGITKYSINARLRHSRNFIGLSPWFDGANDETTMLPPLVIDVTEPCVSL